MHLANALLRELETPNLSTNQRALLLCRLAKQLERGGDYEGAREALTEVWPTVGERPLIEGLDDEIQADVLLRVGSITGWMGSARQIEGAQEIAKDLISESAGVFENLGLEARVGEARSDLALCYWREGAFDEARVTLEQALTDIGDDNIELKAIALLRKAIVERSSTRLNDALSICNEATHLFTEIDDHLLIAHFHHCFANVLNQLSSAEHRKEYIDRALIEYAAASFHFEEAGHIRYQACVYINLGFLFFTLNRFSEAHENLDHAQVLFTKLKDNPHLAQVDETRSRVLLAEGRIVEAEKTIRNAVKTLEAGHDALWLTEALTTHGIALARLNHPGEARDALERAIQVAEKAGDFENAGVAALTIIEELGNRLSTTEICEKIDHTGTLLQKTQDMSTLRRLTTVIFEALFLVHAIPAPADWTKFNFRDAVTRYEKHLLQLALKDADGMVTRASRLLGFKHHQSLIALITTRHSDLIALRSTKRTRRHHLMSHTKHGKKKAKSSNLKESPK
jgi:tetratricopeptide (TPR) repeat protein